MENKTGSSNKTTVIVTLVLIGVLILASVLYSSLSEKSENLLPLSTPSPTAGNEKSPVKALDFTVYDAENREVRLSDFFGKPIVLNFWSSRCSPCQIEMPYFQKAFEEFGEEVEFVMVNLTDGNWDTVTSASAYTKKNSYTFPIYFDTTLDAAINYAVYSIPATYFIDRDGFIKTYRIGVLTEDLLQTGINLTR
ncbi:MAG: TlpA family protein disulfide reductase [Clostridia bacterium]|nr:TlpA family protein disulfide reductase [Clostridia bacterium]